MERLSFDAQALDRPVVCPAGDAVKETLEGPASFCRIEQGLITAARDPSSLNAYCQGAHELCPTWRAARQIEWENADVASLIAPQGAQRTYDMEDLLDIQEREDAGDRASADAKRRELLQRAAAQGLAPGVNV